MFGREKTPSAFGFLRPDLNTSFVTYSSLTQKSHTPLPVVWQMQSGIRVPGRAIELIRMLRSFFFFLQYSQLLLSFKPFLISLTALIPHTSHHWAIQIFKALKLKLPTCLYDHLFNINLLCFILL